MSSSFPRRLEGRVSLCCPSRVPTRLVVSNQHRSPTDCWPRRSGPCHGNPRDCSAGLLGGTWSPCTDGTNDAGCRPHLHSSAPAKGALPDWVFDVGRVGSPRGPDRALAQEARSDLARRAGSHSRSIDRLTQDCMACATQRRSPLVAGPTIRSVAIGPRRRGQHGVGQSFGHAERLRVSRGPENRMETGS